MSPHVGIAAMLVVLAILAALLDQVTGKHRLPKKVYPFKRVCYFAGWALKRKNPQARMTVDDIDPTLCTHLIFAFANIDAQNLTLVPSIWDDISRSGKRGAYEKFNGLRAENPRLKTLLSIGGDSAGTKAFNHVSQNAETRAKFISNVLMYLKRWGFNGLDIDWEFPADSKRGSPPETRMKFTELVREFRQAFDRDATGSHPWLLTIAVSASFKHILKSYDIPILAKYVDFFNLMTYDFHGKWDRRTGFNSPLFARDRVNWRYDHRLSLEWAATRWVQAGAPRRKLIVGMPIGGKTWVLADSVQTGVGAAAVGPGPAWSMTEEKGAMAYYEVCEFLRSGPQRKWDAPQYNPYAFKDHLWVGYDSPKSIGIKTAWVMRNRMGGVMLWAIDRDDFSGNFCGQGKYPITATVKRILSGEKLLNIDFKRYNTYERSSVKNVAPLHTVLYLVTLTLIIKFI